VYLQNLQNEICEIVMATGKLFIGRRVRELRQGSGDTQVQFAERLGISTSYLNQIEGNQRPVSAAVLLALVDKCGLELSEIGAGETDRLLSALSEALTDPVYEGYTPAFQDLKLVIQNAPGLARAIIAGHQAYRRNSEQLASIDQELARGVSEATPYEEVRDFFHFVDNYVHELDQRAEAIAAELHLGSGAYAALTDRLGRMHGIRVQQVQANAQVRHLNPTDRILSINSYSPLFTQQFQLAVQLAQLEVGREVDAIVSRAGFRTSEASEVCRIGLQNYFAGALMMPYGPFAQAARDLRHDVELLSLRFGTSLEQTCHRLSTLQRPGNKGVPIFFARIDRAGNITKRHSATKLQFARFGAACPLWNAHQGFEGGGRIIRQLAETPDGARYLSMAVQVSKRVGGFKGLETTHVLTFGCEISYSSSFVYGDGLSIADHGNYDPIGVSCRICERTGCPSRAAPPVKRRIEVDHHERSTLPYRLV
jgi:predicted transcriptional regulator/transcriptional regulator with XRE-family HTH domain